MKEVFLACGIKKKDLETDMEFAFILLKKIIVGLGTENKFKNSALDGIQHNFLLPSEREKLLRQEEPAEAKLNIKKKKKKPPPKPKAKPKPMVGKRGSVPLPPPPPPPPPPVPSVPTAVPHRQSAVPNSIKPVPEVDVQTQIANMKLKKVVVKEEIIGDTGKNILQTALSIAIKNRRAYLHMHDDDDDKEEEEEDW